MMVRADFSEPVIPTLSRVGAVAGVITFGTSGQTSPDETVARAVEWMGAAGASVAVYLSSTSVYGAGSGERVTEESQTSPQTQMGQKRLIAETGFFRAAETSGLRGVVLRLPGIYGPGRTPRARFISGAYRFPNGERWSNRIYRDDVATAVLHAIAGDLAGVFNVSDGEPFLSAEFAAWCSKELGVSAPEAVSFDELSERAKPFWLANRRVANDKFVATGWTPRIADYQVGHRLAWRADD